MKLRGTRHDRVPPGGEGGRQSLGWTPSKPSPSAVTLPRNCVGGGGGELGPFWRPLRRLLHEAQRSVEDSRHGSA
jgi:hypothetical protein